MSQLKITLKNLVRGVLASFGLRVYSVRDSIKGDHRNLAEFFINNPDESEIFMQYVYSLIVKEGDCAVDVGANHGIHTTQLSRLVGEKGRVIAFEPTPALQAAIKNNLVLNNVSLVEAAVTKPDIADKQSEIQFNFFPDRDGYSGLKTSQKSGHDSQLITVKTATLDREVPKELADSQKVSFIKIDVEGGDFDVLLGAKDILTKHKPVVVFENGMQNSADLYGYTKKQFFDYFEKLGYKLFQFTGQPFAKDDWGKKGVYWETWLVHKQSQHLSFFLSHCTALAGTFIEDRRQLLK